MVQRTLNVQHASLQTTVWRGRWLRHGVRGANARGASAWGNNACHRALQLPHMAMYKKAR